ALSGVLARIKNVDKAIMGSGNRLEPLEPMKFTFIGTLVGKVSAINDFGGAVSAHDVAGKPNFSEASTANASQQFVIWGLRLRPVNLATSRINLGGSLAGQIVGHVVLLIQARRLNGTGLIFVDTMPRQPSSVSPH